MDWLALDIGSYSKNAKGFDIPKSTIEIIEEYCDSDDDLTKIVDTEDTEKDNLVVENADDSVITPAVYFDNDVSFRNNLLENMQQLPKP